MTKLAKRERDIRPRISAGLLALIILFYYLALGGNNGIFAMIGAALCLLAALVILLILEPSERYWLAAWPGLTLLGLLIVVAAMPAWVNETSQFLAPDLFAFGMARLFGASAMLLAGSWVGFRRSGLRQCVLALIAAGVLDICVGLLLREVNPFTVWGISKGINAYRFTGTLLNANASACLFAVTAILAIGTLQDSLLYPARSGLRRYMPLAMIAVSLLAVGACAITGSRTALFLTLLSIAGMLASDRLIRRLVWNKQGALISGGIVMMLTVILLTVGDTTFDRIGLLEGDFADRVAIWSRYCDMAVRAPLFGYGPASFVESSKLAMETPEQARLLWYVNSPHNIILSLVLEHGVLFVLLLAPTALAMVGTRPFNISRGDRNPVRAATLVACSVVICCALIDIALDVPGVATLFALLVGLAWGQRLRAQIDSRQVHQGSRQLQAV